MVVEAGRSRLLLVVRLAPAGDCHQQRALAPLLLPHIAGHLVAAHVRHADVEEHRIRSLTPSELQRLATRRRQVHIVAGHFQDQRQRLRRIAVIVGYQHLAARTGVRVAGRRAGVRLPLWGDHAGSRQIDREGAAATWTLAAGFDRAAVQCYQSLHQRQPYPEATLGAIDRRIQLREHLEQFRHGVGRKAYAGIDHRQRKAALRKAGNQPDVPGWIGIFRGIGEQVRQCLGQPQRIDHQLHRFSRQHDVDAVPLGVDQRPRGLDRRRHQRCQVHRFLAQLQPAAGDARHVQQVVQQQRHALYLARDHIPAPLQLPFIGRRRLQQLGRIANRRQRIAQLVRQRRQELILAPVRLAQRIFGMFQAADIQVDAGPASDLAVVVANRHALGQYRVILAVGPAHAVVSIPVAAAANAFAPRFGGCRQVIRMQHLHPSGARALLLRQPEQAQELLAGIGVAALRIANPYAVVDRLADRAIQLLALAQCLLGQLLGGHVD